MKFEYPYTKFIGKRVLIKTKDNEFKGKIFCHDFDEDEDYKGKTYFIEDGNHGKIIHDEDILSVDLY